MKSIYSLSLAELIDIMIANNFKKYNAIQIYEWLYKKRVNDYQLMTNIKKEIISFLEVNYVINTIKVIKKEDSNEAVKYLFSLSDNNSVEAVVMYHDYGTSLCISTQVGCNMGCTFCESGRLKKVRNLTTNEMVEQIILVEADLKKRITHLVLMGIGEPFDNYDNVINFINIVNDSRGIELGTRHITISTCGIIPKIKDFMNLKSQVNLAISLHAPNDELRSSIMPINRAYPLKELMKMVKEYVEITHRRVTFEYIMLKDVNDSKEQAIALARLLKGINCYVNLIPYNETNHIIYKQSDKKTVLLFYDTLKQNKINVTIRREFGSLVNGACGQLRSNHEEE